MFSDRRSTPKLRQGTPLQPTVQQNGRSIRRRAQVPDLWQDWLDRWPCWRGTREAGAFKWMSMPTARHQASNSHCSVSRTPLYNTLCNIYMRSSCRACWSTVIAHNQSQRTTACPRNPAWARLCANWATKSMQSLDVCITPSIMRLETSRCAIRHAGDRQATNGISRSDVGLVCCHRSDRL